MNRKVTVVGGAGNVGATVARGVADKQLADVVVIDIADKKAAGVALDMFEACPVWGSGERVIGMAGILDSARMRSFIAKELSVSVDNVHAFVLGGHGDTMVPLPRYSTVAGVPITELMDKATIDAICARTARGGLEITELVGTSAWYAPGASVVEMVEAILLDKHKIVPCSVFLQGEYGVRDLFVGVPVRLGAKGLEKIIEIKLTPEEDAAFKKSAAAVKELVDVIHV